MKDLIISMATINIGSLCLFLKNKKNKDYLDYLNSVVKFNLSILGLKNGYRTTFGNKLCYINARKKTCRGVLTIYLV